MPESGRRVNVMILVALAGLRDHAHSPVLSTQPCGFTFGGEFDALDRLVGSRGSRRWQCTCPDDIRPRDRERARHGPGAVSYTHLRAHETPEQLVCRLLLE